ncbi:MAG TPA: DUF1223 domain-containing protein, partial [Rhodanobacteraceae bacterium]|nr:DUF1223 domain-containing protein [Rhodanobacteraceae bacterium]
MRNLALLLLLAAATLPRLHAECTAESGRDRPHLVELYTSEGCSSCPPAEKWMSSIRDDARQVGLEFHVDYWDELGWRDPFADARYTARQRTLAERGASSIVYTPQIIVDGRVWKNWPATSAPIARATTTAPSLSVGVTQGNGLRVHL